MKSESRYLGCEKHDEAFHTALCRVSGTSSLAAQQLYNIVNTLPLKAHLRLSPIGTETPTNFPFCKAGPVEGTKLPRRMPMSIARKIHAARKRSSQPKPLKAEVLVLSVGVNSEFCFSTSTGWVDPSCGSVCNGTLGIDPLALPNAPILMVKLLGTDIYQRRRNFSYARCCFVLACNKYVLFNRFRWDRGPSASLTNQHKGVTYPSLEIIPEPLRRLFRTSCKTARASLQTTIRSILKP